MQIILTIKNNDTAFAICDEVKKMIADKFGDKIEVYSIYSDQLLPKILKGIITEQNASISFIQRKFKLGYARSANIIDQLEQDGFIGSSNGAKPREIKITLDDFNTIFTNKN